MTTQLPAFDFNSPQITTTNPRIHKQKVNKLAKPYMKEMERVCQEIRDECKNKKPKVHFLLCDKEQALHIHFDCVGYAEDEYHEVCFAYAVEKRWIRTNYSDFDMEIFRSMSNLTRGVLQKKKSHLLVLVVDGYICMNAIISPNASPKGFGSMIKE